MEELPHNAILYADSNRGRYIPQHFAESIDLDAVTLDGMAAEAIAECLGIVRQGPDADGYWDAWHDLELHLTITEKKSGKAWHLFQDGDLWLVPA